VRQEWAPEDVVACWTLVAEGNEDGTALLASLKRDPGAVGLDSLLTEINKLNAVRQLGLPDGLFADCSEKLVAAWRARREGLACCSSSWSSCSRTRAACRRDGRPKLHMPR
jgi:hypothetical protein